MTILVALGAGTVAAFVWSFALAVGILQLKHWRNARLVARGAPAYKDCMLSMPFVGLATVGGAVATLVLVATVGATPAVVAIGALAFPFAFALLPGLAIASQLRA